MHSLGCYILNTVFRAKPSIKWRTSFLWHSIFGRISQISWGQHGTHLGPAGPRGLHVGPMNLAIRDYSPPCAVRSLGFLFECMLMSWHVHTLRITGPLRGTHRSPIHSPRKNSNAALWCFPRCVWTSCWTNGRCVGDFKRFNEVEIIDLLVRVLNPHSSGLLHWHWGNHIIIVALFAIEILKLRLT